MFVATMVALITTTFFSTAVTSAMVGLAINYTLLVPVYLNWVVKFFADLETYMSAVERTEEFATIPAENYRTDSKQPRVFRPSAVNCCPVGRFQPSSRERGRPKGA